MKLSRRALRMQRHHRRHPGGGLSLVALIDIFTTLLFFLLVNSGDAQDMPNARDIHLPESSAAQKPHDTLTIIVSRDHIIADGRVIVQVSEVLNAGGDIIEPLKEALNQAALKSIGTVPSAEGRPVTILGDREIPFRLLKKIMSTCTEANYTHISLAVLEKVTSG